MTGLAGGRFRNVSAWVQDDWIEIGPTDGSRSFIRVMSTGGTVWEGAESYASLDDALAAADAAIDAWWTGTLDDG